MDGQNPFFRVCVYKGQDLLLSGVACNDHAESDRLQPGRHARLDDEDPVAGACGPLVKARATDGCFLELVLGAS